MDPNPSVPRKDVSYSHSSQDGHSSRSGRRGMTCRSGHDPAEGTANPIIQPSSEIAIRRTAATRERERTSGDLSRGRNGIEQPPACPGSSVSRLGRPLWRGSEAERRQVWPHCTAPYPFSPPPSPPPLFPPRSLERKVGVVGERQKEEEKTCQRFPSSSSFPLREGRRNSRALLLLL